MRLGFASVIWEISTDIFIGMDQVDGGFFFTGPVDQVAILTVALDIDDVRTIMNDGLKVTLDVSAAGKLATHWALLKTHSR